MQLKKKRKTGYRRVNTIDKAMGTKLVGLLLAVILALVGLSTKITWINITEGANYKRIVLGQAQQRYESRVIPYRRGDILDRNGTVLATSEKMYNLILDCKVTNHEEKNKKGKIVKRYYEPTIKALVKVLGIDKKSITKLLSDSKTKDSGYQILAKEITIEQRKKMDAYLDTNSEENKNLSEAEKDERDYAKGFWFEETYKRIYPLKSLASDAIGFTYSTDDSADFGLEGYYSDILKGTNGRQYGYFNTDADVEQTIIQPQDGNNIVSTLDVNVQQIIRKALEDFNSQMTKNTEEAKNAEEGTELKGAENVGVIVMNPNNGEILGMDSTDWYDLNNPRDLTPFYTDEEISQMNDAQMLEALNKLWNNFTVSSTFEPGSTFKPMTVSAALDSGAILPTTGFVCDGQEKFGDTIIHCTRVHGKETFAEALKYSCNDALMQIGAKLTKDRLLAYQKAFGFGAQTGIDLPNEKAGILFTPKTMGPVELASTSFGQGFTCTMIQEAAAFSAAINGGLYYKPHMVKEVTSSSGASLQTISPTVENTVISAQTSSLVRQALGTVVQSGGSGAKAKIAGYSMGGKTGTAQKLTEGKGKYLVSFAGFAPLDNPQVVVYVVVDKPKAERQDNNIYAVQIARQIFTELLPYMNVFPDEKTAGDRSSQVKAEPEGISDTTIATPPQDSQANTTEKNKLQSEGLTNEEKKIAAP